MQFSPCLSTETVPAMAPVLIIFSVNFIKLCNVLELLNLDAIDKDGRKFMYLTFMGRTLSGAKI